MYKWVYKIRIVSARLLVIDVNLTSIGVRQPYDVLDSITVVLLRSPDCLLMLIARRKWR